MSEQMSNPLSESLLRRLWAKSYTGNPNRFHPLWCHLLDVAAVCEALLPRFGGVRDVRSDWLPYLVALHDIGKADARFQGKAPLLVPIEVPKDSEGNCAGFRHEARSSDWLCTHLQKCWGWSLSAARVVAQATRGHHGDFQAGDQTGADYNESEHPGWIAFYGPARDQLAALIADRLGLGPYALNGFTDASVSGIQISGLIVLSDWIASNPEVYRYPILCPDPLVWIDSHIYLQAAREEARRAVRSLEMDTEGVMPTTAQQTFAQVWPRLKGFVLRPSQQALEEVIVGDGVPPGLAIIEAPMGEGKTEAALYLAACWGRPGAYIALPTQATGNQMHRRYARFLADRNPGGPPPRLVHGMAWLQDGVAPTGVSVTEGEDAGERLLSREWFSNAKRALLAQDGVGTVDQVLLAALNVKHGFLRLLGLSTKTLIIDEVHAYDVYMTTLMKTLLRWCRALGVPVILLSATLSRAQKLALADAYGGEGALPMSATPPEDEPYPLLTFVPPAGPSFVREASPSPTRTVTLRLHPGLLADAEATVRLASEAVAGGGCVCVLANTVRSAQEIFQALQANPPPDTRLLLFHARFRAKRRMQMERLVVRLFGKGRRGGKNPNRPPRAILVATQVVEQSLDIDFDAMLSQIAPIDLLLQRSGRLHRHAVNDPRPPSAAASTLHVLLPPPGGLDFKGMEIKPSKDRKHWRGVYDRAALLRTLALLETRNAFHLPADFRLLIEGCYGNAPLPVSSISAESIQEAEELRKERRAASEWNARTHLVPDPSARVFRYAQKHETPVAEAEEGERASFFRAQTREGDDSRAVLILHDLELFHAVQRGAALGEDWRPNKTLLKRLFLQKVSLPGFWFANAAAAGGYEMVQGTDVPKRLRPHIVLLMREGHWEGVQTRGKDGKESARVTITDDHALGLTWAVDKENADDE